MKILFLYVSTNMCRDGDLWYFDEGIASVAACLRAAGHGVAFRMVALDEDSAAVKGWVEDNRGATSFIVFLTSLMFSAYGHDLPESFGVVRGLGEATGLPVGFVGLHATMNPDDVLRHDGIDFVGRGEMDEALVEFCDAFEAGRSIHQIRNFWVKAAGEIHRNELRPLVEDLAALPFPARDLLVESAMANERDGILTVIAMRGCPMDCNFCSNPVLKKLYDGNGKYTRFKPVDYVIGEIRAAVSRDPSLRAVFFHDDIFALNGAWAREFFARYGAEVGLPYGCNLVIGQADAEFAGKLGASGCRQVQIGVESGSNYLRNEIINKNVSEQEIIDGVAAFRDVGVNVKLFAMMGLPEETRWRYRESVRNFARYRAEMVQIQVWEAHEGSDLLTHDPDAGRAAGEHYRPGKNRRAWRIKFFFHYFHRFIALYEALDDLARRRPLLAALGRCVVDAAIMFRWTPDVLLARDFDGTRRWPAALLQNDALGRLTRRLGGKFWDDVMQRETRLASVYIWPDDLGAPPSGEGWVGTRRVDGRGRRIVASA